MTLTLGDIAKTFRRADQVSTRLYPGSVRLHDLPNNYATHGQTSFFFLRAAHEPASVGANAFSPRAQSGQETNRQIGASAALANGKTTGPAP